MNHVRASFTRGALRRGIELGAKRRYATEPPNPSSANSKAEPSRVGMFYKTFSTPTLKVFLGAIFTYQLAYWGWMKLELLEEKRDNQDEIEKLKGELKTAVIQQKDKARGVVEQGKEKVEEGKKKGWLVW